MLYDNIIGLFVAYRVCWMSGRVKGRTSTDCIRKAMAHLVLQVPHVRLSSAWRIYGEVSIHLAALISQYCRFVILIKNWSCAGDKWHMWHCGITVPDVMWNSWISVLLYIWTKCHCCRDGIPYCEKDYQKQFGVKCAYCNRYISGKVLQVSAELSALLEFSWKFFECHFGWLHCFFFQWHQWFSS